MKTVLLEGKFKVGIVRETPYSVLVVALEDALTKDADHRLEMMCAGRSYWFCRSCFERRILRKVSG
jgi:hypothetical protein